MRKEVKIGKLYIGLIVFCALVCVPNTAHAQAFARSTNYVCELGLQAGVGYYVGDAAPYIFMQPCETYGAHFRYKFTPRWAIQVKGLSQRITGWEYDEDMVQQDTKWQNRLINLDVMGEFNFFRFGGAEYDARVKQISPYIFLGIGASIHGGARDYNTDEWKEYSQVSMYLPVGIGLKWKFAPCCGLNIAWQHNLYFTDGVEGSATLRDLHELNGHNWLNCDITGQLTAAFVFEFAKEKKVCRHCEKWY